ncbi:MAG: 4Fe-4S dicluster domain-containing protein, partial [Elusimicrobiota bacterium]
QMPALAEEIEEAREEGVGFEFLVTPSAIKERSGGDLELTLGQMKLGEPDASGRASPVPIEGAFKTMNVSYVIKALGETLDISGLAQPTLAGGYLSATGPFPATSGLIFACGDCTGKTSTAAEAIRAGREMALKVSALLGAEKEPVTNLMRLRGVNAEVAKFKQFNKSYFSIAPRPAGKILASESRKMHFNEMVGGLAEHEALGEALRCFQCGTCNLCGNCELFCPDRAIVLDADGVRYKVNYDYCKGCAVCVEECPRAAIHIRLRTEGEEGHKIEKGKNGL